MDDPAFTLCPACGQQAVAGGRCYRCLWSAFDDDGQDEARSWSCDGCGGALMYAAEKCPCNRQTLQGAYLRKFYEDLPAADGAAELAASERMASLYEAELGADPAYQAAMAAGVVDRRRELERRWGEWMAEARAHYAS